MQLKKIILILTLVIVLALTSAVYAEPTEGWQGYGLYNIGNSKLAVISEDVSIKLTDDDKLIYKGEFLIKNYTNAVETATFGMPANGINNMSFKANNSSIKWKKRSYASLNNEFKIQNQLPKEDYWYVVSFNVSPGETKILSIQFEALQHKDEQGSFVLSYFNDRELGFSNSVEKSSIYIDFNDFEPYNLLELQGIDPGNLGIKGDVVIKAQKGNTEAILIKYADIVKKAADSLMKSPMHKPREIALAFNSGDYSKTSSLCDEYIKNPNDSQISQEQMLFFKAEGLRKLGNFDKYLEITEALDYSKLYPAELKNKIYYDRMNIYFEQQNQDKILNLLKEMKQDTTESTAALSKWIEDSSVYAASQINSESVFKQIKEDAEKEDKPATTLEEWYNWAIEYKYTPIIIFAAGFLSGLLIRGLRSRRRRRRSRYTFKF